MTTKTSPLLTANETSLSATTTPSSCRISSRLFDACSGRRATSGLSPNTFQTLLDLYLPAAQLAHIRSPAVGVGLPSRPPA